MSQSEFPRGPGSNNIGQELVTTSPGNPMDNVVSLKESEETLRVDDQTNTEIMHEPVHQQYDNPSSYRFRRVRSKTLVSFGPDDPENPFNWGKGKKFFVIVSGMMQVTNSTIGSSLPSGAMDFIADDFNITTSEQLVLPISLFLVGYVIGPLICGPMSEQYGRKWPLTIGYIMFLIFTMACALAPSLPALLVFRLFSGMAAAAPISIITGTYADVHDDPTKRGRAMAWFMACTTLGPIFSPFMSGFVATVSWRWAFWLGLIIAGASCPFIIFYPETYGPVLLHKRAKKLRKETGDQSIVAPIDLMSRNFRETMAITLSRPFRMIIGEYIVSFTCLYLSLAYAIFYLYFQAYPIIFQGVYGMSPGVAGLMYLPIGVGAFVACGIFVWYDGYLARAKERGLEWAHNEDYRRLPLACIGGPLYVVSLFWLGWTASSDIHWAVPMMSGVIFGLAYELIFMAMLNYLSDAYEIYSASAQSAASCCRSICGALLPLAARPMFDRLGISWACSLIAFLSLGVSLIPFAFIYWGRTIRNNSKFCQQLRQLKEEERRAWEQENARNAGDDIEKAAMASEVR
ncbi:hypothetical protein VTN49DRAFT_2841 [Thermomyces lanuginosus]|uniref:uncharacterized protein n=1 Tax=Thermomyces lanuginosus TaxID=5541 RepID=UPI0037421286